jgi:hypothetical protein
VPLRKRLHLVYSPAEETPLPVILKVEKDGTEEDLYCWVQPSWNENIFRIMMDLSQPKLPRAIIESDWRPAANEIVSVCASPGGHSYLEVGQAITITFTIWDGRASGSITLDCGILIDFTIPDLV